MEYINNIKRKWGNLDESWRFALTAFLVARIFYALWSWVILTVQPVAVHYINVGNKPGVIFLSLQTSQAYGYLSEVNGIKLSFHSASKTTTADLQTNSIWDIHTGIAMEGQYKGRALSPTAIPSDMFPYHNAKPYPNTWLALWQRFDANWYTSIAENGYGSIEGDHAFPPLFPLLIRLLIPLTRDAFLAGLLISHVATVYALKLIFDTFTEWGGKLVARETLVFMLLFPTAFFFFSAYTESLFLVFTLLSLRFIKSCSWPWAGFWIFCATLTRVQGLALLLPMSYAIWRDPSSPRKFQKWAGAFIASSGALFYFYLRSQYSTSLIPSHNSVWEPTWHWTFVPPWEGYLYAVRTLLSGQFNYIDFLNWAVTTVFIILLIIGWKKIPVEYNLFVAFSLLIMLTRVIETKPLNSMFRYMLTLFPVFYLTNLGSKSPWSRRLIIYTCLALNLYLSAEFFGWGWVA